MSPVQSQPIGQFFPAAANLAASEGAATGKASNLPFSSTSPQSSADSVQTGMFWGRPLPGPSPAGPNPNPLDGGVPQPTTPGTTGNSFLDLIANLISQLDSVISGLGGGATSSPGNGSTPPASTPPPSTTPPVCTAPLEPDPGFPPDPGGPIQRLPPPEILT